MVGRTLILWIYLCHWVSVNKSFLIFKKNLQPLPTITFRSRANAQQLKIILWNKNEKIQRSQCCELTLAYFYQKRTKESAKHQLVSAKFIVVISSCTALIPFQLLTLDLNHFSGNIVNKAAPCTQVQFTKGTNPLPRSSTSFFVKAFCSAQQLI